MLSLLYYANKKTEALGVFKETDGMRFSKNKFLAKKTSSIIYGNEVVITVLVKSKIYIYISHLE